MAMVVNQNHLSGNMIRNLNNSYGVLMKSAERLSSGFRINRAADDPAGLVISENLRSRISSLTQEIENTTLAINKYTTADSTISEARSIMQSIRTDIVSASNRGVHDDAALSAIQSSIDSSANTYNRMVDTAEFNGANLLDGGEGSLANIPQLDTIDVTTEEGATQALAQVDKALANLDSAQVEIGATQKNELESRRSNLEVTVQNLISAESTLRDADIPAEIATFIKAQIQMKVGISLLAHSNMTQRSVASLFG